MMIHRSCACDAQRTSFISDIFHFVVMTHGIDFIEHVYVNYDIERAGGSIDSALLQTEVLMENIKWVGQPSTSSDLVVFTYVQQRFIKLENINDNW